MEGVGQAQWRGSGRRSGSMSLVHVQVVGMHVAWKGGDVVRFPGGGHKVNMLRPVVDQWKEKENVVVMFVDRYMLLLVNFECTVICSNSPNHIYGCLVLGVFSKKLQDP